MYLGLASELLTSPELGKARQRVGADKKVSGCHAMPGLLAHKTALAINGCGSAKLTLRTSILVVFCRANYGKYTQTLHTNVLTTEDNDSNDEWGKAEPYSSHQDPTSGVMRISRRLKGKILESLSKRGKLVLNLPRSLSGKAARTSAGNSRSKYVSPATR